MKNVVSLFCHATEPNAQAELQRQHDLLAQFAAQNTFAIEHCFFHVGIYNFEKPDVVLLSFLQSAQHGDLSLVLIESVRLFPIAQKEHIPLMEVYFVKEKQHKTIGNADAEISATDSQPGNHFIYWGR